MVPSWNEEKAFIHDEKVREQHRRMEANKSPINVTESDENVTSVQNQQEEEEEFVSILDNRPVIIATESDENTTSTFVDANGQNESTGAHSQSQ